MASATTMAVVKTNVKQFHQQHNFLFVNRISWNEFFCFWFFFTVVAAVVVWSSCYIWLVDFMLIFFFTFVWLLLGLGVSPVISFTKKNPFFFLWWFHAYNFCFLIWFRFMLLLFHFISFFFRAAIVSSYTYLLPFLR